MPGVPDDHDVEVAATWRAELRLRREDADRPAQAAAADRDLALDDLDSRAAHRGDRVHVPRMTPVVGSEVERPHGTGSVSVVIGSVSVVIGSVSVVIGSVSVVVGGGATVVVGAAVVGGAEVVGRVVVASVVVACVVVASDVVGWVVVVSAVV